MFQKSSSPILKNIHQSLRQEYSPNLFSKYLEFETNLDQAFETLPAGKQKATNLLPELISKVRHADCFEKRVTFCTIRSVLKLLILEAMIFHPDLANRLAMQVKAH